MEDRLIPEEWRKEWAAQLAQTREAAPLEFVARLFIFQIDGNWYGIQPNLVEATTPVSKVHYFPDCIGWIDGVINFRGRVIPCINPGLLLKSDAESYEKRQHLILNFQGWLLALPVSSAEGIHSFLKDSRKVFAHAVQDEGDHAKVFFNWDGKSVLWIDEEKLEKSLRREVK